MKKIISLVLITLTLLGCSVQVMAKEDKLKYSEKIGKNKEFYYNVKLNDIYYDIEIHKNKNGKIKKTNVISYYAMRKGNVLKYPDKIKFKGEKFKVNVIEYHNQTKIPYKNIYIPKYATNVDYLFKDLSYVENIYISKSVNSLNGIQNWQNVNLIISNDNKYLKMQNGAVYSKDGKTLHYLVNAQKQYQISAGTENVEIKDNKVVNDLIINSEIKKLYLSNVKNLSSVTFPEGIKSISRNTFDSCKSLGEIIIEDKDKAPNIELQAFINSKNQIDFYVKNQKVADDLFYQLKIKDIGIDKANIYVENTLVYQNVSCDTKYGLAQNQVRMGENIIGTYSDDGKTLTVSGDGEMYRYRAKNDSFDEETTFKFYYDFGFKIKKSVENIVFNGNITYITDYAFKGTNLLSFTMPSSVKEIGAYVFYDCKKLSKIDLGNNIEKIGPYAIYGNAISSIKLPKSLKTFDCISDEYKNYSAFLKCNNLTTIDIGECNSKDIANFISDTFRKNKALKHIKVSRNNTRYFCKNDILFNKNKTKLIYYSKKLKSKSYKVPKSVVSIENKAFYNQEHLKNIKLNKGLRKIGMYGLAYLDINSISVPNSVKKIEMYAFYGCRKLKSVKLSKNISGMYHNVFQGCASIKKIDIPKKVTWFGSEAFLDCKNLAEVAINNTNTAPNFNNYTFDSKYLNFYVKNKNVAKSLKKNLKGTGVKNAKIYIGNTLVYSGIN